MSLRLSLRFTFSAPAARVWPIIANTERLNRAIGLPVTYPEALEGSPEVSRRRVRARQMGVPMQFDEEPFEWVENESYRVFRRFAGGPFRTFRGGATLTPTPGGCELNLWTEMEPRSPRLGPLVFSLMRPKLERDTMRFVQQVRRHLEEGSPVVYGEGIDTAPGPVRARTESRFASAPRDVLDHPLAPRLMDYLAGAGDVDLERIRPFKLAREWGADRYDVLRLCLRAARAGVLDLSWDLLCPNCRGGDTRTGRLDELRRKAHCDSCHIVFDANFDRYVEVTFRPNPRYRRVSVRTFCAAGPRTTPHIVVQTVLQPGEEKEVRPVLAPGGYRIRTLTGYASAPLNVEAVEGDSPPLRAVLSGQHLVVNPEVAAVPQGAVTLLLRNETEDPAQLVLERLAWDVDAAPASAVTVFQEFRDLFSSEVLAPDVQLAVESLPLLFTDLQGSTALYQEMGDAPAFALVRDHFRFLQEEVAARGGGILKTIGDSVMAAFPDAAAAVGCALSVQRNVSGFNQRSRGAAITLKMGLHQGPCIAVRGDERLDYFGSTVNIAARLHQESRGGDIVISEAIRADAVVEPLLREHDLLPFEAELKGIGQTQRLWRVLPNPAREAPAPEAAAATLRESGAPGG